MSVSHNVPLHERNRWLLPLAVVTGAALLAMWFPANALWHQQTQIDLTAAQIRAVQRQESALAAESKSVSSDQAARQLAREQYQLVSPGQSLVQILPGAGAKDVSAGAGDPGLQPLVSPSSVSSLGLGPAATTVKKGPSSIGGFFARLERTLEFWR